MSSFVERLTGATLLDAAIYEEVEHDRSATFQAMGVVLMSSLAAGIGLIGPFDVQLSSLAAISLLAFAAWATWALVTLQIGTRLIPAPRTDADMGQLLRTIGFATAPGIFRVAGAIPGFGPVVFAVTAIWMLMAMIVAVRQALDYSSSGRAFAVCALGWGLAVSLAIAAGIFCSPPLH